MFVTNIDKEEDKEIIEHDGTNFLKSMRSQVKIEG